MKRLVKVIITKLFALDRTGTDFAHRPEQVEADGFRPYFVEDLMKWTGITCRDTITKGLRWLSQGGIINLRKPIRDGLTGRFSYAMIRFNPGVLNQLAERVITLMKSAFFGKSPCRMHSASSCSSSPGVRPSEKEDIARDRGCVISSKDKNTEEVIGILKEEYPDVLQLDYAQRKQLRGLVNNMFKRYRLTAEMARELVKCKRYDDETVNANAARTLGYLQGFNRFDKFMDLVPFWKKHISKILRGSLAQRHDRRMHEAESVVKTLEWSLFSPEAPGSDYLPDHEDKTLKQFVEVVQERASSGLVQAVAALTRPLLIDNPIAYGVIAKQIPQVRSLCRISHLDHNRLLREFKNMQTKISVWSVVRSYVGL